jgi:hypothetical protein
MAKKQSTAPCAAGCKIHEIETQMRDAREEIRYLDMMMAGYMDNIETLTDELIRIAGGEPGE